MFCTKSDITHIIQDEDTQVEIAHKPFLVIMFGHSIGLGMVVYFYHSALRKRLTLTLAFVSQMLDFRRNHQIRKLQINLLDLKLHFILCNLLIYRMFLDQLMNRWFIANYEKLGSEMVFNLWLLSFYFESAGKKK